ncbi:MAG: hypothetical protein JXA37_10335 [Chloroflexia bacterium]|nr:hypothetical protein [Chloroflexia bacterium]
MAVSQMDRSFARLYEAELPRLYRYIRCRVATNEEAEGLTADVLQQAQRRWERLGRSLQRQRSSTRSWLFALATDYLAGRETGPAREAAAPASGDEDAWMARLAQLPERDRIVLALRFGAELDDREIGQVLKADETASRVALLRALRQLCEGGEA